MRPSTLDQLKRHIRPGRVYRREDLLPWSHSVDRHLKKLTVEGTLQKLRTGLYYCPRKFEFGQAPAGEHELVKAFLRTDHFVITSPNLYNQLGLGTTQLSINALYTTKSGMVHFRSVIEWLSSSEDSTFRSNSRRSSCWSILLTN